MYEARTHKGNLAVSNIRIQTIEPNTTQSIHQYRPVNTSPYLSRFEKTQVISNRISQLSNDAESYLDNFKTVVPCTIEAIALEELHTDKLPFLIVRTWAGGYETEIVHVNHLLKFR